ncbi:hypothetical protein AALP_AA7G004500 [Arabis alpina]|uniref:RRM domain-containing protein n=1 Tax=Arabis alpina TaxID=50452 RepID=A0A087GF50_ARAAL|nr:hypothetical protein AALP_AA7G004500 [Arabis alpina]
MDVIMPLIKTPRDKNMSKEEFISRRSLELCSSEIRTAALKIFAEDMQSRCVHISVEGFDTSLPEVDIELGLYKHLKQCGHVHQVVVTKDLETNLLNKCALVRLRGEGAGEHALALNGSDFGGWKAVIQALPNEVPKIDPKIVASLRAAYARKKNSVGISVGGYDTSLHEDDVKDALIRHFCICGEITQLGLSKSYRTKALHSTAVVYFARQTGVDKAVALNGSDAGGWKVEVEPLFRPTRYFPEKMDSWFGSTPPAPCVNKTEVSLHLSKED